MGPTAKELEPIKDLIQFDHEYFKHQPESKTDLNGQTEVDSFVSSDFDGNDPIVFIGNEKIDLRNVNIIISSENGKHQLQTDNEILQDSLEKCYAESEVINESDFPDMNEMNFDLLDDLEKIIMNESEELSCSDVSYLQEEQVNKSIDSNIQRKGLKRKADEAEIDAIVVNLKAQERHTSECVSIDSGYTSDEFSSSDSVGSPASWQDVPSPTSDKDLHDSSSSVLLSSSTENPLLAENSSVWEESFTELSELFPDLV